MPRYLENKLQTSLICENPSYRKHIIETASKKNNTELFKSFVQKFYSYLPVDYMEPDKTDFFTSIAEDAFAFCQARGEAKTKVEFLKHASEKYGGSVLQISTQDQPFIVDSIKTLLAKFGVNIKIFLHPVICLKRSKNGDLIDVSESGKDESIICAILYDVTPAIQKTLVGECERILNKINLVVDSSEEILTRLKKLIEAKNGNKEDIEFLEWVASGNFTFLGSLNYDSKVQLKDTIGDSSVYEGDRPYLEDTIKKALASDNETLFLGKMNQISEVSTGKFVDYILVRNGQEGILFFGFYMSGLYTQSVKNIPILSGKLHYVLERSGFKVGGYNYKKLHSIAESFPRDALFQIEEEDLYCICLHILSAMLAKTLKLFIQTDSSGEFLNVLVFMPMERLTPESHLAIIKYLTSKFSTRVITEEIADVTSNFCSLYVTLETKGLIPEFALSEIEQELDHLSAKWHFAFTRSLSTKSGDIEVSVPENTFPKEYQYRFSPEEAADDYKYLCDVGTQDCMLFNLQKTKGNDYTIKIYSTEKLVLSDTLPLIENLGFRALSEQMFAITMGHKTRWLCEFMLSASTASGFPFDEIKRNIEDAMHHMAIGDLENDILCNLVVIGGLNWRQVNILKAITAYITQTGFVYGSDYVQGVIVKHHEFADLLIKFFEAKFTPNHAVEVNVQKYSEALGGYLNNVTSSVEDKVLRTLWGVIAAITRTNCYQINKNYLSFKFNSEMVPDLPLPHPYAEIFVYSNSFEAVHLRGGKVARGGIRWSDRREDYRTEALGLMKAQMTKNTVIVPVGSKGAFYVKLNADNFEKKQYFEKAVECYKNFLRGLLDITDNILDGKIVHPQDTVIYDEDDPYLVVAADKGTATFSDYANSVSAEYNFWLGDAFASGGSAGYDHKKMAITAKGAWISVTRHFAEIGIDVQKDPITVVGIGDMAGDVFGNGMLLSQTIKLVAAFNHSHIFIDPSPDAAQSFIERKRLFDLPGSKWSDYSAALISEGGGVYERSSKKIPISQEAKQLLEIEADELAPEVLINTILKAKVDLIWNGGIGTYVKASDESHLEVGDKANDSLRCNGNHLRAKVIGEGGNLGFSQRGRVEYAKNGGKINTDFIDNSAGVDCSDHEVNIKIAFGQAVKNGSISITERNQLLSHMTDEVANLVLQDNFKQTEVLTIAQHSPAYNIGMFAHLMNALEQEGLLNRDVEFLPYDGELARRSSSKEALSRPEIAVIMSYSKMSVYNELLASSVATDKAATKMLIEYFPPLMQKRFEKEILSHPLRSEIILTVITNKIINQLGGPIINHIRAETGAKLCDIVRSYMIVNHIFNIDGLWKEAEDLSSKVELEIQIDIFSEIIKLLRRGICWFIRNLPHPIDIASAIESYGESVQKLCSIIDKFLLGQAKQKLDSRVEDYKNHNVPELFAHNIAALDSGISTLDILLVANSSDIDKQKIAELYFKVADSFSIDWMRKSVEKQITDSYWNRMSIQALKDDLYDKQRRVLQKVIAYRAGDGKIEKWLEDNSRYASIFTNFIAELKLQENIDLNMMIIANKQFEMFLRKV